MKFFAVELQAVKILLDKGNILGHAVREIIVEMAANYFFFLEDGEYLVAGVGDVGVEFLGGKAVVFVIKTLHVVVDYTIGTLPAQAAVCGIDVALELLAKRRSLRARMHCLQLIDLVGKHIGVLLVFDAGDEGAQLG